jgi:UDP-GlcNAc:undecaprenyl-phosphate GlcNAc-1-phosphate transferase
MMFQPQPIPGQTSLNIGALMLIFGLALGVAVLATPLVRRAAARYGVIDAPSARKIHANPVPLLGGLAIYLGVLVSLFVLGHLSYVQEVAVILVGATLMSMLGVWDDKWGMRPMMKLVGPVAAAALLFLGGLGVAFP